MGTAASVKMGVCNITFNSTDLGYTKGAVSVSYQAETVEKTVDQEDAPIGEIVAKQTCEVKVPIAEHDLALLENLIPGATLTVDGVDLDKKKLVISGASGVDLTDSAAELVVHPTDEGTLKTFDVVLHHAVPVPNIEFAYEKENQRIFEVTFKALKGVNGFVTFGDPDAAA
jgi:hypothetical protein